MTPTEQDYARRLREHPKWRWMAGMTSVDAPRVKGGDAPAHQDAEEWRAVPAFGGVYEVSSHGRVRSWRVRGTKTRADAPTVMTGTMHEKGYRQFAFRDADGSVCRWALHRLVLVVFDGPPPSPRHQAHHIDNNPRHNHVLNLEWVTPEENSQARWGHGSMLNGAGNGTAALSWDDAQAIRVLAGKGHSAAWIARAFGVNKSTAARVIRGDRYVGRVPDLSCPATLGCLWAMLREAYADIRYESDAHRIEAHWHEGDMHHVRWWDGATFGEALAPAVLAAWGEA